MRASGDDFVVLLEALRQPRDAAMLARDLIEAASAPVALASGQELATSLTVGISIFPDDGDDAPTLFRNAETALHGAKADGRGGYRFYTWGLTETAQERLAMAARLRRALEQDEFVLYFQPVISVASGRILGAEALLRWLHPGHGLVPPDRFIPLAEETGLIEAVGGWALRAACREAMAWRAAGHGDLTLAVNLSGRQFHGGDLDGQIAAALWDSGLDPRQLELEITESVLMEHREETVLLLDAIKARGIRLAIDDFGTGYSSLAYLKRFAADRLKVDRSFIDDLPDDPDSLQITSTLIAMVHGLNMVVTAEGVETEAQRGLLEAYGCDAFQGYLVSPPVPAEAFRGLLNGHGP